jgi:hypothetical protein
MAEKQDPIDATNPQYAASSTYIKPQRRKPHDPQVTFEEYHYYALRTREEEQAVEVPKTNWREIVLRKKNPNDAGNNDSALQASTERKISQASNHLEISDEEWTNASRAFRTASSGACESTYEHCQPFRTGAKNHAKVST